MLQTRLFHFNPLGTACSVIWDDGGNRCVVADPGMAEPSEVRALLDFLAENRLEPDAILLTHGHFDHVWGVRDLLEKYPVPVYMHPADKPVRDMGPAVFKGMQSFSVAVDFPTVDIADGDSLKKGGTVWKVIHTPGHTPGGVAWYCEESNLLLSGDTLFAGSIGRTDLAGGDYDVLIRSVMDRLMGLPGDTDVIPGHGGPTTIGREAMTNPFLIPFNEKDSAWWDQDGIELDGENL